MKTLRDEVIEMLVAGEYDPYDDYNDVYRLADDITAFAELHNALQASDVKTFMDKAKELVNQINNKDDTICNVQRMNRKHKRTIEQLNREISNMRGRDDNHVFASDLKETTLKALAECTTEDTSWSNEVLYDLIRAQFNDHKIEMRRLGCYPAGWMHKPHNTTWDTSHYEYRLAR